MTTVGNLPFRLVQEFPWPGHKTSLGASGLTYESLKLDNPQPTPFRALSRRLRHVCGIVIKRPRLTLRRSARWMSQLLTATSRYCKGTCTVARPFMPVWRSLVVLGCGQLLDLVPGRSGRKTLQPHQDDKTKARFRSELDVS